ncbi:unnamed protein product [Porites evermanni]|uniref:DDB1- and CUL4-associated factor 12 beta-propeller domain-containing protein n=1 Tax=Porites evermanni TaxID=104178 RepID=A0ABN8MEI2_9CNID|nr:unnamed protein product [Porites evermanni]
MSLFKHVTTRQTRVKTMKLGDSFKKNLTTRQLPSLFKEREVALGRTDKVFASQWLDERKVVCGTKSNQLLVLDMTSDWKISLPVLEGSPASEMPEVNCGIHSIKISPERNLLATRATNENSNFLFFHLILTLGTSEMSPIYQAHNQNNSTSSPGSRDGSISLWCVQDPVTQKEDNELNLCIKSPASRLYSTLDQQNKGKDKIRDLVYERNSQTLVSLSALGYVHLWDMNTCQAKSTMTLKYPDETVCLALEKDNMLFAVGSQSHISFYDVRCGKAVGFISSSDRGAGVRSLSFRDLLLTVGTGLGSLFFFDMRTCSFLAHRNTDQMLCYRSGKGWLRDLGQFDYIFDHTHACCSNAVYTHCYDPTGTKLFAAGGPLSLVLYGNYAALWE